MKKKRGKENQQLKPSPNLLQPNPSLLSLPTLRPMLHRPGPLSLPRSAQRGPGTHSLSLPRLAHSSATRSRAPSRSGERFPPCRAGPASQRSNLSRAAAQHPETNPNRPKSQPKPFSTQAQLSPFSLAQRASPAAQLRHNILPSISCGPSTPHRPSPLPTAPATAQRPARQLAQRARPPAHPARPNRSRGPLLPLPA